MSSLSTNNLRGGQYEPSSPDKLKISMSGPSRSIWQPWKRQHASIFAAKIDRHKKSKIVILAICNGEIVLLKPILKVIGCVWVSFLLYNVPLSPKNIDFKPPGEQSTADLLKSTVNKVENGEFFVEILTKKPSLRVVWTLKKLNDVAGLKRYPNVDLGCVSSATGRPVCPARGVSKVTRASSSNQTYLSNQSFQPNRMLLINYLLSITVNWSAQLFKKLCYHHKLTLHSLGKLKWKTNVRYRSDRTKQNFNPVSSSSSSCSAHKVSLVETDIKRRLLIIAGIEMNPGPPSSTKGKGKSSLLITTYNVRGLNDESKLRHMLSHFRQELSTATDSIICLQETFIEKPGKIPYIWRGNFFFTAGLGNSCGCITLLNSHVNIVQHTEIENRGHVLVCQKIGEQKASYIVANVYAPNGNNQEKITFFEKVLEKIYEAQESFDCDNIFLAGDLNLIFHSGEIKNRQYSANEQRVAREVGLIFEECGLIDAWKGKRGFFTWRRANTDTFSCLDRVLYRKDKAILENIDTNWALSLSDHAAVRCYFSFPSEEESCRSRISRIDPTLLQNEETRKKFVMLLEEKQREILSHWDPHMKLDYIKMCIRTIAEQLQAERKKVEKSEEQMLNEELEISMRALEHPDTRGLDKDKIIEHVENLRIRKEILVEEKGKRLAHRLGTKWYNEGEKSSRYFLRLLQRSMPDNFKEIERDGEIISTQVGIEAEIVNFYKGLYETYDKSELNVENDDDFFSNIKSLSGNEHEAVTRPLTSDELHATLKTCKDSAPGPDGIPYGILRSLWPQVGKMITDAWNFSLEIGSLPTSHKNSYLRLIPKVGKDLKKLTNWRPITLSNCDHKIITKTYASRMSKAVGKCIEERQTAYLKGRLINDNIRSLILINNLIRDEDNMDNILISLDAKKAFDSVEHGYIEKCLVKFGLQSFVPIFRTLYKDLRSNIIINGKVVDGYSIKRGVKQGDALSCILFIMCIEPLLRNIDNNPNVEQIVSAQIGPIPKTFAYADDVNCAIKRTQEGLQAIFYEYERLTRLSGLELNADKTEIMKSNSTGLNLNENFRINYRNKTFNIAGKTEIKINGILFQQDSAMMADANVDAAMRRMDHHFAAWSRRGLSTLGKILITKTFGISQLVFVMQSMTLNESQCKRINGLLYKFIWNRHYRAAKAPDRIKREIIKIPIKQGGFGMLDVEKLDESLKLRALGRLLSSNHPVLKTIKESIDVADFFHPKCSVKSEEVVLKGVDLLKKDRQKLWHIGDRIIDLKYGQFLRTIKLRNILNRLGKMSIQYFRLVTRGIITVGEIGRLEWNQLKMFVMDNNLKRELDSLYGLNNVRYNPLDPDELTGYPRGRKFKKLESMTSKEIRESRAEVDQLCVFKIGLILTPVESVNYFDKVNKLTCTRLKNTILRVLHGDIYSRERLYRFGLVDNPQCETCNEIETTQHKLYECPRVREVWNQTLQATDKLRTIVTNGAQEDLYQRVMGACLDSTLAIITIHAEILHRISFNRDPLPPPRQLLQSVLLLILGRESKEAIKAVIRDLLNQHFAF